VIIPYGFRLAVVEDESVMHPVSVIVPGRDNGFESGAIFANLHWDSWRPGKIVHANISAVPGAPKDHELLREFGSTWVFEKIDPPPPVPSAVLETVFRIDLPYVVEDLMHASSRIR
jgi:hypothetical protein